MGIPRGETPRVTRRNKKDVPVYGIPRDELVPDAVFRALDVGPDWGVHKLNVPAVWPTTRGEGVKVAVLDTGIDFNHPDLAKNVGAGKNFTSSRFDVLDVQGHGTHCAGVVLQVAPGVRLLTAKVLDDRGSGSVDDIADGIDWAVAEGADVISMSLGGSSQDNYLPPALARAVAAGVVVIVAAGNDGPKENTIDYPGAYHDSLAVAAVDEALKVANFSSRGANVFVAAPGVSVRSTYPGGQYATMSGTSMATPHVAGLAALWVSRDPGDRKTRPARFREALKGASKSANVLRPNTASGYGCPDAVLLVPSGASPPPEPPVLTLADFTEAGVEKLRRMLK